MNEAVFFDLDKTFCSISTEGAYGKHMFVNKKLPLGKLLGIAFAYLKYDLHLIKDYQDFKSRVIKNILGGQNKDYVQKEFFDFFNSVLKNAVSDEMKNILEEHKREGRYVFLISAAADFIAESFSSSYGFKGYCSTVLQIKNDLYTGEIEGYIPYGKKKCTAINTLVEKYDLDLKSSYAYGDYYGDRHMLEMAGNPVAVNPDKKLHKYAQEKKWDVVNY